MSKSDMIEAWTTAERHSMAQLCREHDVKEQVMTHWRAIFLDRAEHLFGVDTNREGQLEHIADLERLVG